MKINDTAIRATMTKRKRWNPAKCVPLRVGKWVLAVAAAMMFVLPFVLWLTGGVQ